MIGEGIRLRRADPADVLDGVVASLEPAILAAQGDPARLPELVFAAQAAMMSVGVEAIRLREEGWAPRAT